MSRLRIGWASPWNWRSAIAQSAFEVAIELSKLGHSVSVLRTEIGEALALDPRPAPGVVDVLAQYSPERLQADFDIIVAHIGDNYAFHGSLPPHIRNAPFVGIFHDAFIANLAIACTRDEVGIRNILLETYGEDTWPAGEPFFQNLGDVARRRPMLEWLARYTVGAVAHAEFYTERLRQSCPGPVRTIPLAYTVADLPPPPVSWNRLTIGVVGHANPNKCIEQIVIAVGASPILRKCCRIRVIGEAVVSERIRLQALAQMAQINALSFTGWVSEDELRWQLRDVDVISCLRNPVLEGASASLVLALTSGRPTLVSAHGCYAELPDDTVMFCSPNNEARDVLINLERIVQNPEFGKSIGARGKALSAKRHAPAAYAAALIPLLEEVANRSST